MRVAVCYLTVALLLILALASCKSGGGGGDTTPNPFAGDYSGTYTGSEDGVWTADFAANGAVTAVITSPSVGVFNGTGTISRTGALDLTCSGSGIGGPFTIQWQGTFQDLGATLTGTGTWVSTSGFTGTWEGQST